MQYVTSIPISSSTPDDSNDDNDVDMNSSAIPSQTKRGKNELIDISQGLCQGGGGGKGTETQDWDRQKLKKKDKFEEIYGQYLKHQGTRYNHLPIH